VYCAKWKKQARDKAKSKFPTEEKPAGGREDAFKLQPRLCLHTGKTPSVQAPSSRDSPNFKTQFQRASFWNLEFGISLELGAWNLELFIRHVQRAATLSPTALRGS
jgi:hypothetical protein